MAEHRGRAEQVTVTETVTGEFGAAQVTAANGGTVTDLLPTRTITPRGFISAWLLLGPFIQPVPVAGQAYDNPGCPQMQLDYLTDGDTLEVDIFPEAGQTIATDFGGVAASLGLRGTLDLNPGGVPTWNAHFNKDDTIDFNNEHYFADIDQVMMYAFAYVWAENDVDVDLCTDSDDSIQVIIDGGEAWCNSLPRGMQGSGTCVDTVPYGTLSAGEHTVMVKVFEGGGGHGFRFAFKAAGTSDPAPGLSVCLTPDTKPCVFKPIGASISWEVTRQQLVDGVGYALDLDSGRASFKGDVEGLRITGDAAVNVCPLATNLLGQIMDAIWLVVGPFANANNGCLDATGAGMLRNHIAPSTIECLYPVAGDEVPFDPADPDQASTGYLGPLGPSDYPVVQQFDDGSQNGDLDLDAHTGPADDDGMMSWLITYVEYTGAPGQVGICLGSDDSAQVWFNDQMIVNYVACQGRGDCDKSVTVDVVPGAYRIAFGVWENNGGWGGRLSLRDAASQAPILDGTSPDWKFWGTVRPPAERFAGGFIPCTAPPKPKFKRGDSNADGDMNITDGIFVLNYLFLGGSNPPCTESAEANDDGELNITDGIYILNFLFLGGAEPPAPGNEACGEDPAGSVDLGCESYPGC